MLNVRINRRIVRLGLVLGALAAVTTACYQPPAYDPGAAPCVPVSGTATSSSGATLTVSEVTCLSVGDTVTVTGTGFTTTGNLGTRPPAAGLPAGVYAVFGEFAPVWRPSLGSATAPSSTRKVLAQAWNVPQATFDSIVTNFGPQNGLDVMAVDGSFTATITITAAQNVNPNLGFVAYAGGGSVNAGEELLIPASWEPTP